MSHFRIAPRIGLLQRTKHIYRYLKKYKHGAIQVHMDKPDLHVFAMVDHEWLHTLYANVKEAIPEPLGESVVCTHFTNANFTPARVMVER
jgi:hypothetical protein